MLRSLVGSEMCIRDSHNVEEGVLFWPSGDVTSRFIEVPIVNDEIPELTETFVINFGLPSPASTAWPASQTAPDLPLPPAVEHPSEVTVSITNDDGLLQSDNQTDPLVLLQVLSSLEVSAVSPPTMLAPFEVRAVTVTTPDLPQCAGTDVEALVAAGCTEPLPGADISWTVFPDPDGRPGDPAEIIAADGTCLLYTSPSPRDS